MLEHCGPGEIPGDPEAVRAIADALERGSRDAEEIAELIRAARSTALAGWDAASAGGYEAFCAEALTCAAGLIDIGPAAAKSLRTYATELEAAQRAFADARQTATSAEDERDSAERGSRAEHSAEEALGDAKLALGNAREAALAANERAAREIDAIADRVPAAPAAPVPPASLGGQAFVSHVVPRGSAPPSSLPGGVAEPDWEARWEDLTRWGRRASAPWGSTAAERWLTDRVRDVGSATQWTYNKGKDARGDDEEGKEAEPGTRPRYKEQIGDPGERRRRDEAFVEGLNNPRGHRAQGRKNWLDRLGDAADALKDVLGGPGGTVVAPKQLSRGR